MSSRLYFVLALLNYHSFPFSISTIIRLTGQLNEIVWLFFMQNSDWGG